MWERRKGGREENREGGGQVDKDSIGTINLTSIFFFFTEIQQQVNSLRQIILNQFNNNHLKYCIYSEQGFGKWVNLTDE